MAAKKVNNGGLGLRERAVYELIERGGFTVAHIPLYKHEVMLLTQAGLIRREGDRVVPTHPLFTGTGAPARPPTSPPPREPAMPSFVVRCPQEIIDALQAHVEAGEYRDKSTAARTVLARGLGLEGKVRVTTGPASRESSGMHKAVRNT
jgi:Arc/MetJ-type ribon-helix-helix transcriptional regulator